MSEWVRIQNAGFAYDQYFSDPETVLMIDSVVTVVNGDPGLDGTFYYANFTPFEYQSALNAGWTGKVRATVLSLHIVSPGVGVLFQPAQLSLRASGDSALLPPVDNTQPPYPDAVWGASDVTSFTPPVFEADCSLFFTYNTEIEAWQGPNQHLLLRTSDSDDVSYELLIEVEMDAVAGCFWTDLTNVRQEC